MTQATNTTQGQILLGGDFYGTDANAPSLITTGVTPLATQKTVGKVHVDVKGRITWQGLGDFVADIQPIMPTASTSQKGVVALGRNINVDIGGINVNDASTTQKGVMQVGSGFLFDNGSKTISINPSNFPIATSLIPGIVQVGYGLNIDNGTLSLGTAVNATSTTRGIIQPGSGFAINGSTISIPITSNSSKGLVQFGNIGLAADKPSGTMHIRKAATGWPGLVYGISGIGIGITNGSISFDSTQLPTASSSISGIVKIGSGFVIGPTGSLSISTAGNATSSTKGSVQIGSGLTVNSGIISIANSSDTQPGYVQVSTTNALTIDGNGLLEISKASNSSLGVITTANNNDVNISNGAVDLGGNISQLINKNVFTKAQISAIRNANYSGTLNPDYSTGNISRNTLTGNLILAKPINATPGQVRIQMWVQDSVGGRTLTLDPAYKTNQTITLSTAPNAVDLITIICVDANTFLVLFAPGY
jgi:hypothetical protein